MRSYLLLILTLFSTVAGAQTLFQGTVKGAQDSIGIEGVNIMIQEKDKSIALKEVKITSPKIKQMGDTIEYILSSFMNNNDRTIEDVLKKLPGIDVEESGRILYQSKPIDKFYIEGLDLLQGRYGIATKNVEAKDVLIVQVLENNQEIKILKDRVFSEQAAINLKLKESAKGVLTANTLLGAGLSPLLWAGEVTTQYFAKNRQNISTYKGNNAGNNVSTEQRLLYSLDSFQQQDGGLLSVQSPAPPSIAQKRHLFNQSNAVSLNNLLKTSSDCEINANINYLNEQINKNSFSSTEYFLLRNEFLKVEELLTSKSYVNQANADIQLNANKDKLYFNNTLKFEGGWNSENGDAISQESVKQELDKPNYSINNNFCQ